MILQDRIELMARLGDYMLSNDKAWQEAREKAGYENGWFTSDFITIAVKNIATHFLEREALVRWAADYHVPTNLDSPKLVGLTMAGNIPLVGFHDLLSVFISGHVLLAKTSSKDDVLIRHLVEVLAHWDKEVSSQISFSSMLKNCDAYIATGSNNTSRYFEYYFGRFPHVIRKNKTSIAVLEGNETETELELLGDDIFQFFGLGCRNITKIYVPRGYDFIPLLDAFKKYLPLADHHKYKNNYDYNLAIHILNRDFYMTNGCILLAENPALFSPISQLNYEFYDDRENVLSSIGQHPDLQCIAGHGQLGFGQAQSPALTDYADKVDTMAFLQTL